MSCMPFLGTCRWCVALLIVVASQPCRGECAMPLMVHYNERPPFLEVRPDGSPGGVIGTPARLAFAQAEIPVKWEQLPTNRQLATVMANRTCTCIVGWFRNSERETYAVFTQPVSQDQPFVAIVHRSVGIAGSTTVDHLLSMNLPVLAKENLSYGPYLDSKFATYPGVLMRSTVEIQQQIQMLLYRRASIVFMSAEEGGFLLSQLNAGDRANLVMVQLSDAPPGQYRHIMCSKQMDPALLDRLNRAIVMPGK